MNISEAFNEWSDRLVEWRVCHMRFLRACNGHHPAIGDSDAEIIAIECGASEARLELAKIRLEEIRKVPNAAQT